MQFIILALVAVIATLIIMILSLYKKYRTIEDEYYKLRFKILYSGKRFKGIEKDFEKAYKSGKTHARVYYDTDSVISHKDTSSIYPNVIKEERYDKNCTNYRSSE